MLELIAAILLQLASFAADPATDSSAPAAATETAAPTADSPQQSATDIGDDKWTGA